MVSKRMISQNWEGLLSCDAANPQRVGIVTIKIFSKQTDRVSPKIGQILGIEPYK